LAEFTGVQNLASRCRDCQRKPRALTQSKEKSMTVIVEEYHRPNVRDNKDPLARQTRKEMVKIINDVGGKMVRFEVVSGVIFVDTDKDEAAKAVIDRFSGFKGVTARVIDTLEAIFQKSQLRPAEATK
jgi:hypothetical protein